MNEKMINAANLKMLSVYGGQLLSEHMQEIVQAAINAAWTTFDPKDKETWSTSDLAPSGNAWLCLTPYERSGEHVCTGYWNTVKDGGIFIHRDIQDGYFSGPSDVGWLEDVTAYADPADLTPPSTKES